MKKKTQKLQVMESFGKERGDYKTKEHAISALILSIFVGSACQSAQIPKHLYDLLSKIPYGPGSLVLGEGEKSFFGIVC